MKTEEPYYLEWDGIAKNCESLDLPKLDKKKAIRAIEELKRILGDDFPRNAIEHNHPLFANVINRAPWTRIWLTQFYESLASFENQGNFESLITRIKDPMKFPEALSVLDYAWKFKQSDFDIEFDPDLTKLDSKKVPDIKITNTHSAEDTYVEVSMLKPSRIQRDAHVTLWEIQKSILASFMLMSGRIYKSLSPKHLQETAEKVEKTMMKAKKDKSFECLHIPNVIDIAFAPESDKELLEAWAEEHELKVGTLNGPSIGVDENLRIKRKIEHKQKQVPSEHANIIVIQNTGFIYYRDIEAVITELEEEVYRFPHLLGVIVSQKIMGGYTEPAFTKNVGQHIFISKPNAKILSREEHIILLNKYCDHKVSPSTISQIISAFVRY